MKIRRTGTVVSLRSETEQKVDKGGQVDVQTTVENTNVGRELKSKNLTANNQAFVV
jgi:hypothetical protein